jgi:hypothetical protein
MTAIESAVRVIVDLLVRGQYMTAEKVTRSRRLTANEMASAIAQYGRTLVAPAEGWWPTVEITPIDAGERPAFHVAAPLWTREEGRSDLTLELHLEEYSPNVYETEVLDIHVM